MEKPLTNYVLIGHCLRLQKHPERAMFEAFPELGMAKQSRGKDDVGVCYVAAWLSLAIAYYLDIVLIVYTAACMDTSSSTQASARLGREGSLTYDNGCMNVGCYPKPPNQGRQGRILGGFWDNKAVYSVMHRHLSRGFRGECIGDWREKGLVPVSSRCCTEFSVDIPCLGGKCSLFRTRML